MFSKVLIANRGEIAIRVISACRELGILTVAVYSEADANSLHTRMADEEVCIGPSRSIESYLSVPAIISAAEITGADAIHPGYGFLSESAYLADVCDDCGIKFIGPSSQLIRLMGEKAGARQIMKKAGLKVLPGSDGVLKSVSNAVKAAKDLGFPVMIKATNGGGGRGLRIVNSVNELEREFVLAEGEAVSFFGKGGLYLEKFIPVSRHIEFQILADNHGNVINLGERECSLQRRHQKVLEESPSLGVSEKLRRRMGKVVVDAAKGIKYASAGTFEFLMDETGDLYFLETNTRLQVEHPVSEMVSGVDIVKEQIRIADGQRLSCKQDEIVLRGHAIECRVNAECPETFVPSPGVIRVFSVPGGPGVRIDTFAHSECLISPYYDSLIAKIITHGQTRDEAIARMRRTLEMTIIEGIKTTIPLHLKILSDPDFIAGKVNTRFLERFSSGASE